MGVRQSDYISKRTGKRKWEVFYRDAAGKPRERRFDTKKLADAHWVKVQGEIAEGIHTPDGDAPTLEEMSKILFRVLEDERSARATVEFHKGSYRTLIKPTLGGRKINRIAPSDVQRLLDDLKRQGRSAHALSRAKKTLGAMLDEAIRQGKLSINPVRSLRQRRRSRRAIIEEEDSAVIIPEKEDVRAMIDAANAGSRWVIVRRPGVDGGFETVHTAEVPSDTSMNAALASARRATEDVAGDRVVEGYVNPKWLRPFLTTLAFSGMRIGEARGLAWSNIDFDLGFINVMQAVDNWNVLGPVKTVSGRRTIPIGPFLVNTLRAWKKECPGSKFGLVFPSRKGTPITYRNVLNRHLQPIWIKLGQTDDKGAPRYTPHTLRHFCVSLWVAQGADAQQVAKWVGHQSAAFTMRIYAHLFADKAKQRSHIAAAEADVMGETLRVVG